MRVATGWWQREVLDRLVRGYRFNPIHELQTSYWKPTSYEQSLRNMQRRAEAIGLIIEWLPLGRRGGKVLLITALPREYRRAKEFTTE